MEDAVELFEFADSKANATDQVVTASKIVIKQIVSNTLEGMEEGMAKYVADIVFKIIEIAVLSNREPEDKELVREVYELLVNEGLIDAAALAAKDVEEIKDVAYIVVNAYYLAYNYKTGNVFALSQQAVSTGTDRLLTAHRELVRIPDQIQDQNNIIILSNFCMAYFNECAEDMGCTAEHFGIAKTQDLKKVIKAVADHLRIDNANNFIGGLYPYNNKYDLEDTEAMITGYLQDFENRYKAHELAREAKNCQDDEFYENGECRKPNCIDDFYECPVCHENEILNEKTQTCESEQTGSASSIAYILSISIEIVGPDQFNENSTVKYEIIVTYADGSTQSAFAQKWGVDKEFVEVSRYGEVSAEGVDGDQTFELQAWFYDVSGDAYRVSDTKTITVLDVDGSPVSSVSSSESSWSSSSVFSSSGSSSSSSSVSSLVDSSSSGAFSSSSSSIAPITTSQTYQVYPLLKTGQTVSYADYDDGWYQIGAERSYSRSNDILTDQVTGLMWQDDAEAASTQLDWEAAKSYCENKTLGGYDDWQLPTIEALWTLPDYGRYEPALDSLFQSVATSSYWSSTTGASDTSSAWYVSFYYGSDYWYDKTVTYYVRCVRGGQFENLTFERDNTTEIVTEIETGRQWQDDAEASVRRSWQDAIDHCEALDLGGHQDWRLPNLSELRRLVLTDRAGPAMDPIFQSVATSYYWSSTTRASDTSDAWSVDFYNGSDYWYPKSYPRYVRCVRGGQ